MCLEVCEHESRDYYDDTEKFFKDLKTGKNISMIVAPATKVNFRNYKKLLGFFKSKGVNLIYDVSFGADITTWGYLKAIDEMKMETMIAQPCPVIVNYVERYKPDLIEYLAPIQSPMMCTAIFLKKYKKLRDDIAFLSPCIAKIDEINDPNTKNYVKYNVTYKKLNKYLMRNNINIDRYNEISFDNIEGSLGFIYSRPGGLKENVLQIKKDAWIRQIEGSENVYDYIENYSNRISKNEKVPLIVDALNCKFGCNIGSGIFNQIDIDDVDFQFDLMKKERLKEKANLFKKKIYKVYEYFDKNLNWRDFIRNYNSIAVKQLKEPTESEYDEIFNKLHKKDRQSRTLNCSACGYDSCRQMAKAIFNKINNYSNCIYYNKQKILMDNIELENKNKKITQALEEVEKLSNERLKDSQILKKHNRFYRTSCISKQCK